MTEQSPPEFDPATWTPDKPWPKGYYNPRVLWPDYWIARSGDPDAAFRTLFWFLLAALSQWIGYSAATAKPIDPLGLLARDLNRTVSIWPLLLGFTLVLPALLYMVLVARPGTPWRSSFARGLVLSLGLLALVALLAFLRPALHAVFALAVRLLQQ